MKIRSSMLLVIVVSISMLALWGCPKSTEVSSTPEGTPNAQEGQATEQKPAAESMNEHAAAASTGLQPIYFDFDKSFIRDDSRSVMRANAEWLKANPTAKVRIEGNCDERGTKEYNQALGQRRAASAKKYLTDLGIAARRISLISYGKEKPICTEHNEDCWQKNRRDDFVSAGE